MTVLKSLFAAALLFLLPAFAQAQVFCNGPYALCIKAACVPVTEPNGQIKRAVCSCTVEEGYSMGPAACSRRLPIKHGSTTHMMSTYSNFYNDQDQNMTCKIAGQTWANCYGAPCAVDAKDPKRAQCTCPVLTGEMVTLGGKCDKNRCDEMWSAATPVQNAFANNHFFKYMTSNHPNYPTKPAAKVCGAI